MMEFNDEKKIEEVINYFFEIYYSEKNKIL